MGPRPEQQRKEKLLEAMKKEMPEHSEFLAIEASHIEGTTAQTSAIDAGMSKISGLDTIRKK